MNEQLDRIEIKLIELEAKIDQATKNSEQVRKYLVWGFWITLAVILLPLLVLPALLPAFLGALVIPTDL